MSLGPGSAAILDLKAELLRKHNNVDKKNRSTEKIEAFTVRKGGFRIETRKPKQVTTEHVPPPDDVDDEEEALRQSRRCLEEKARLYETKKAERWTNDDEESLVDFNRKRKLEQKRAEEEENDDSDSDPDDDDDDDDNEWTTFEDSLGRTRKCLKSDLAYYLEENRKLTNSLASTQPQTSCENIIDDIPLPAVEAQDPLRSFEDPAKGERLKKWDEIDQENNSKEHLHYQDVLFDEIREHGQAHFEFSRDDTERAHQMKILDKLREDSTRAQKITQEVKRTREAIHRERMNKIRIRRGLAPEPEKPPEPTPAPPPPPPQPSLPPKEGPSFSSHVRPWDEGKEVHGVPIKACPKPSYIEERREERLHEFAPPRSYSGIYGNARTSKKTDAPDVNEFLKNIRNNL